MQTIAHGAPVFLVDWGQYRRYVDWQEVGVGCTETDTGR
jgi:hypothetical protein